MFILTEMQDVIRIEPWQFNEDTSAVVVNTLNKKFANKVCERICETHPVSNSLRLIILFVFCYKPRVKVVHKIGLCIALFDITHFGNSYLFPGDGSSHTKGWRVFNTWKYVYMCVIVMSKQVNE